MVQSVRKYRPRWGAATAQDICLATVPGDLSPEFALLHQPLEEGRAALSVFVTGDGSAAPLLLTSIEWTGGGRPIASLVFTRSKYGKDAAKPIPHALAAYPVSASPPTVTAWTRTGRNSDWVHVALPGKDLVPVRVDEVRIAQIKEAAGFVFKNSTSECWVRPALSTYASPLYVHRHLALLATHEAEGMGHAFELLDEASLIMGMDAPIAGSQKRRRGRIVEFEVPARPLGAGSILKEFKSAIFDLRAVVRKELVPRALAFWVRPLGSAGNLGQGWTLSLVVSLPDKTTFTLVFRAPDNLPAGGIKITSLMFLLDWAPGGSVRALIVDSDGKQRQLPVQLSGSIPAVTLDKIETITLQDVAVSSKSHPVLDEWWADVSMLTLPGMPAPDRPIPFSFKWLFSGSGQAPAVAVSSEAMRAAVEVEARIVCVSPPVPVTDGSP